VHPRRGTTFGTAFLLVASACSEPDYVIVKLQAAAGLPPLVQLVLHASDGNTQSTVSYPQPAGQAAIVFPKSYVVSVPKGALSLAVEVDGLDAAGDTVARGSSETLLTGVTATISITLSETCASALDCGSTGICSGAVACGDGGFCVAGNGAVAPDFTACDLDGSVCFAGQCGAVPRCSSALDCGDGVCSGAATCSDGGYCVPGGSGLVAPNFTPCNQDGGLCYGGQCIAPQCGDGILDEPGKQCDEGAANSNSGTCTLACRFAACGDGYVNQDPLADGGVFQEGCDWGSGADGGPCTGPSGGCNSDELPDHCRTDCLPARCGDGTIDTGERCDLGAPWPDGGGGNGTGSGCNITCTLLERVTTFAGNGQAAYADGTGTQAAFDYPSGLTIVDGTLYVADQFNDVVRAIDLGSAAVTTLAGQASDEATVDGTGAAAAFYSPILVRPYQGGLVVTEPTDVRTLTLTGTATLLAGQGNGKTGYQNGPLLSAEFTQIEGLAASGTLIFVSDSLYGVRSVDPTAGVVSSLNDAGILASYTASGLLETDAGLYFSDSKDSDVQTVSVATGKTTVVAGDPGTTGFVDGTGAAAEFHIPGGMCTDGFSIYVMDEGNSAVRQLEPGSRRVTTVAGNGLNLSTTVQDGVGRAATFGEPADCAFDPVSGDLFVVDQETCTIRRIH
jgi:hypothetical protein